MPRDIGAVDKNLKVETKIDKTDLCFHDVRVKPFRLYGFYKPEEAPFKRLPFELAKEVNYQVDVLAGNTSCGRVRFKTNSEYVAIKAVMPDVTKFSHMPLTGSSGFDLYYDIDGVTTYYKSFVPPFNMTDGYESVITFKQGGEKQITINFPLYNNVTDLYIGLQETATLTAADDYKYEKPILFYGSSITQGGCASRPGNCYPSIISRWFNTNIHNLGFSSGGCGEENILEYMAKLDFSIFVMDYDYNSPSVEHLRNTHSKSYNIIRKHNPDAPIILVSRPDIRLYVEEDLARREIIRKTYTDAVAQGDKNVYFVDGYSLFGKYGHDGCTVDGTHPNDLGFWRMAEVIGGVIELILK